MAVRHLETLHDTCKSITSPMQLQFICRQPRFAKLEPTMKHPAKANAFITELKAKHPGSHVGGASSSSVSGSVMSISMEIRKKRHPEDTVVCMRTLIAHPNVRGLFDHSEKRNIQKLQPNTCPVASHASFHDLIARPERGRNQQHQV